MRFYKSEAAASSNRYPYDRAERFAREIRKLGTDGNTTFLDKFRQLITEIGNAMGYVRMVRAGGLHHCAQCMRCLPDAPDATGLPDAPTVSGRASEGAAGAALSADSAAACSTVGAIVEGVRSSFEEDATPYFAVLEQASAT